MRWDEQRFGREYDLDVFNIVAVSDFNMGAMENKGLNIFNDRLILASAETATDANFEAIESVVAHEYFHNWTGNRITCRDWFQLCLKEGLTVFRDQEFSADERSRPVQRIADVRQLKAHAVPRGRRPARPSRAARQLHRDQQLLHGDRLREGRRAGAHDRDHRRRARASAPAWTSISSATTARPPPSRTSSTCFEDATGVDLTQFTPWYAQAGTPELVCKLDYDKAAQDRRARRSSRCNPPTAARAARRSRCTFPSAWACSAANGHEIAAEARGRHARSPTACCT